MTLPVNKYVDQVGTEVEMVNYDAMARRVWDEVTICFPASERIELDDQAIANIADELRHWGDCFYRRGAEGKTAPALIQPLKLVG